MHFSNSLPGIAIVGSQHMCTIELARTIADMLDGSPTIKAAHITEAPQFRPQAISLWAFHDHDR